MNQMFQALEVIVRTRRSCRKFSSQEISDDKVRQVLSLVPFAPSSIDCQPWRFKVIRDRTTKQRLVEIKRRWTIPGKICYPSDFVAEAPVVVVICVDVRADPERFLENGWIARTIAMLTAASLGLGDCILTTYREGTDQEQEIRALLGLPESWRPVSLMPLGFPATNYVPPEKRVRALSDFIDWAC